MFIRKYKSFMLILFFTLLISLQLVDAKMNNILPLEGKIITIDPGHPSYLFPSVWYNK